jgi:hypothetical protein
MEDQVYCFEIARRSVGRAALHLGIDSMSEASLDVMADVLLSYLNRVGRSLSHLVECSGRSSAHANILDAFRACEVVSAPVVQRLHLRDGSEQLFGAATPSTTNASFVNHNTADWKGLAAFLFGPKWLEEKEEEEEKLSDQPGGGKRGPSATADNAADNQVKTGWNAPYLDEIPPFPQASDNCANPHTLPAHVGLSLHREEPEPDEEDAEEELEKIPDDVFAATSWGDMMGGKRKSDQMDIDDDAAKSLNDPETSSPPTKKVKFGNDSKDKEMNENENEEDGAEQSDLNQHHHIPSFFPKPPVTKRASEEGGRTAVDVDKHTPKEVPQETDYQGVRSSLVQQSGYYWGSGWDSAPSDNTDLAVPLGRTEGNDQSSTVIPLGRASGSRVSRILEGSMDAAAMQ